MAFADSTKPLLKGFLNCKKDCALDRYTGDINAENRQVQRIERANAYNVVDVRGGTDDYKEKKLEYKRTLQIKKEKKTNSNKNQSFLYKKVGVGEQIKNSMNKRNFLYRKKLDEDIKGENPDQHEQDDENEILRMVGNLLSKMAGASDVNPAPSRKSVIRGLSTSSIPYIILDNGNKIFEGGKLEDGCSVENINQNYIILECNGQKKKQAL